jgi:hypothetical protein
MIRIRNKIQKYPLLQCQDKQQLHKNHYLQIYQNYLMIKLI